MALSPSEILQRHKEPVNRRQLDIAIRHEDKVKFSVKKCLPENLPFSYYEHLRRIEAKLPEPKFKKYVAEITFPLPHVKTADTIFSGLGKVWDSDKRTIDPQFTNPDLRADFIEFLEYNRILNKFETDIWEAYKSQHNSILVVDMAQDMQGRYPEPYINIIDICAVVDVDVDKNGNIIHLIYKNAASDLIGIDESFFYIIPYGNGKEYDLGQTVTNWHGLAYCPAVFLIQDTLDPNLKIIKESPVSKCLFDFDKLMFRIISGENLEDYVGYPVHIMRENDCEYRNEQGNTCQGGKVEFLTADNQIIFNDCPNCSNKHLSGAGSAFGAMPDSDGKYDLESVLKIVSADVESLNYKDQSISDREERIIMSCLGSSQESMSGQAKNDKQITSIYESQQSRLMNTKRNIEYAMKFCIEAMASLRYEQAFLGCVVDLGSNFFLITVDQLETRLTNAITNGAPQYEVNAIRGSINDTEWRSNPRMLTRLDILSKLEPLANLTTSDILNLLSQNKISQTYFDLKYNFAMFVSRFEDENGDIVDFGINLQPAKKIEVIFNQLLKYANEYTNQSQPIESQPIE